jgi:predicted metal-binding protein
MASERVEIPKDAFLKKTGQLWKLVVGVLVLPLPTALWGWRCLRSIRPDQPTSELVAGLAVLVAAALIIVGLLASVRCPKCGARLVKRLLQAPEGADAITSFLRLRSCPSCGYAPEGRATARITGG